MRGDLLGKLKEIQVSRESGGLLLPLSGTVRVLCTVHEIACSIATKTVSCSLVDGFVLDRSSWQ